MSFYAVSLGAAKWAIGKGRGVWGTKGPSDIEQPMVAVHFANGVSGTVLKNPIEIFYFVFPFTMGAFLKFWEEKRLARVETAVDGW